PVNHGAGAAGLGNEAGSLQRVRSRVEQALVGREACRREAVPGKPRRSESRVDRAEVEAADAVAALMGDIGAEAQAQPVGRLGVDLEAPRVFALTPGAVRLEPVPARHRSRDTYGDEIADRQVDGRLTGQPVEVAVAQRDIER